MNRCYPRIVTLFLAAILLVNQLAGATEQAGKASPQAVKKQPVKQLAPLDHTKLMVFRTATGLLKPVQSSADWSQRRTAIVRGMEATMGPLPGPKRRCPLNIKILEETRTEKTKGDDDGQ